MSKITTRTLKKYKDNNETKNENNKNLYIKFMALKNGLIEERKKTSLLEKENNQLKEEIQKNQELILDLKDEIKKYHDAIDKNGNSNFFSELFNNIKINEYEKKIKDIEADKEKITLENNKRLKN